MINRMIFKTMVAFCLLQASTSVFSAATVYVNVNAIGANTGTSWADAYTDLQDALTTINSGEIWVAAGSYKPGNTRSDTFDLRNNVELYGGFSGAETSRDQRDPAVNETILNADLNDDDYPRFVNGHNVWSSPGIDNSRHIVTAVNVDNSAVLDGFVLAHGLAYFLEPGGISAGGALLLLNSSPVINNIRVEGSSGAFGGGAYVSENSSPTFSNCEFRNNWSDIGLGGAMHIDNTSHVTFSHCHFEGNAAIGTQGPNGTGGALVVSLSSSATIENSSFINNFTAYRTRTRGGNSPTFGGAILAGGDITVRNSLFQGNKSHLGGAIYTYNKATLVNNIFRGNQVTTAPGSAGGGYGGALVLTGSATLINNTITNNIASEGTGGVIAAAGVGESIRIVNTIIWGNLVTKPVDPTEDPKPVVKTQFTHSGDVLMSYGILEGLFIPIPGEDPISPKKYPGVLDTDPLFIDQYGNIGNAGVDLRLSSNSPAIDAGDNSVVPVDLLTDFDGEPRFQDDLATADTGNGITPIVDMGAYEVAGILGDNLPPVAMAGATPRSGKAPLDVQFSSAGSGDTDGAFVTYYWDFGNGDTSTESDPLFTYPATGIYTALLTVTDDQGAERSDSVIITVKEPVINQPPVAKITTDVNSGVAPLLVEFDSFLSFDDSLIVAEHWDFGDGTTGVPGSGGSIFHSFAPGIYTVTLTVTDDENATGTDTVVINVGNTVPPTPINMPPQVNVDAEQFSITLPTQTTTLFGVATDDLLPAIPGRLTYTWSLANGPAAVSFGTFNRPTTTVSFTTSGVYALLLTVSDGDLSTTASLSLTVKPEVVAPPTTTPPPPYDKKAPRLNLTGIIQEVGENFIIVNDKKIWYTAKTKLRFKKTNGNYFEVGQSAKVKASSNADGSATAKKIKAKKV